MTPRRPAAMVAAAVEAPRGITAAAPPVHTGETGWDRVGELIYSIGRLDDAGELLLSRDTAPSKAQRDLAAAACRDVLASLARLDELDRQGER